MWLSYYRFKRPDAQEIQMAVLTAMVAGGLGVKDVTYENFLVHKIDEGKPKEDVGSVMRMDEVQSFFGGIAEPMV